MDPWTVIVSWNLSETLGLLGLNDTQTDIFLDFKNNETLAVFNAENHMFAFSLIPLLLESFVFGIVSIAALLLAYTRLRDKYSSKYVISLALGVTVFASHWALTYRVILLYSPIIGIISTGEIFCEAILFGALTGLVLLASTLFFKPRDANLHSHWTLTKYISFGVVVAMYIAAAIHWGLGVKLVLRLALGDPIDAVYVQLIVASSATLSLSVICSDMVVLWRACAIWMNRRWIVLLSALLIFAITASSIANVVLTVILSSGLPPGDVAVSLDPSQSLLTTPGLISLGTSIFTNIFATLAIAYKTWKHRALVRKHLTIGPRSLITEKIMCIFIESGAVYICFWILYVFAVIAPHVYGDLQHNYTLSAAILGALGPYSYSMIQITAIYPTLIIILVFFEKKAHFGRDVAINTQPQAQAATVHISTIVTMIHSVPDEAFDIELEDVEAEQSGSEDSRTTKFHAKIKMPEAVEDRVERHSGVDNI